MIEFRNLRKVYKSQKGGDCVALDGINLKLPDTGLVFIIGKSGSGKSTLLNLLGGLDTITSGDIIADGNQLSTFDKKDFEDYRGAYIGFVFQHYYLLEELTVRQNIELAMGVVGLNDSDQVDELLRKVGLEGHGNRYPRELSGGQQQRVAIARALAKNPRLILGDELTGNLDHNTSVDILTVLKEISREKLVVIVSHNLDEADMFADRIIELHEGKILRDRSRITYAQKKFMLKGKTAFLPYFRNLSKDEAKLLGIGLRTGRINDIQQQDDGFVMSTVPRDSKRKINLERRKFASSKRAQYTSIFTFKGAFSKLVTIAIVTLMLLCVSVFFSMHKIGHGEIPYEKNEAYINLFKGGLENPSNGLFSSYYYRVLEDEIAEAERISGEKTYRLLGVTYVVHPSAGGTSGGTQGDLRRNLYGYYIGETYGTLLCDEQFLIEKYGVNGQVNYAIKADDFDERSQKTGLIITDYVADSYIQHRPENYRCIDPDCTEEYCYDALIKNHTSVIAVVDTGYRERYAEIIERYRKYAEDKNLLITPVDSTSNVLIAVDDYKELFEELCDDPLFEDFLREVLYSLGINYSFNTEYDTYASTLKNFTSASLRYVTFEKDGKEIGSTRITVSSSKSLASAEEKVIEDGEDELEENVQHGEIILGFSKYNEIFGTGYTADNYKTFGDEDAHNVVFRIYDRNAGAEGRRVIYEETFRIVKLSSGSGMQVSTDDFDEFRKFHYNTIGLYVRNNQNVDRVISTLNDFAYAPKTVAFEAVAGINKIMGVFVPLFKLIAAGLYIFIIIFLINHAMQVIKKNYFQIGVLRSFGSNNVDVGVIFITGVLITGVLIAVLSLVFEPMIVDLYDTILIESFAMVLNTNAFDLTIVNMPLWLPIVNAIMVIVVTVATSLISLLVIRNLKPIEIIRAKDNGGEVS